MKPSTESIVAELRNVAEKIYLDHSIPNAAIYAAADRLEELEGVVDAAAELGDNTPDCRCACCAAKYPHEEKLAIAVKEAKHE